MELYVKRDSSSEEELQHHGILGMKWGVRRYQNKDGSYTKEGKERYASNGNSSDNVKTVKASDVFVKEELDALKRGDYDDDYEIIELMLMEVIDTAGFDSAEFVTEEKNFDKEIEKFKKDPYNYTFKLKSLDDQPITQSDELQHHGILGMHWGIRRYQNPDGTLTEAGRRRLDRKDAKWAHRREDRIYRQTYRKSKREMNKFVKQLNQQISPRNASGTISAMYVNIYNQKLAEVMNKNVKEIRAPSGKLVKWIAKRGGVGVHMALADEGYNLDQVKRGVYGSGRIAYKKNSVNTV